MAKKKKIGQRRKPATQLPPKLSMLIACDAVFRDPSTGKASLYGIFHIIHTPDFPCTFRPFAMYGELFGTGSYPLALWIVPPGKKPALIAELEVTCPLGSRAMLDMQMIGYQFDRPGDYEFHLRVGDTILQPTCMISVKLQVHKQENEA